MAVAPWFSWFPAALEDSPLGPAAMATDRGTGAMGSATGVVTAGTAIAAEAMTGAICGGADDEDGSDGARCFFGAFFSVAVSKLPTII